MQRKFKRLISGMLVMSMLIGGAAAFQVSPAAAAETEKQGVFVSTCNSVTSFMSNIQYKKFMSYLTQEYAPEMKAEWGKAIDERQSIKPVFKIKEGTFSSTATNSPVAGGIKFTPASPDELKKALENVKLPEGAKVEAFKVSDSNVDGKALSMVTITSKEEKAAGNDQQTEDKKINISVTAAAGGENYAAQLELQEELDKAITDNDSQAIKTVLGKMLTNYKQITEELKNTMSNVEVTNK